MKHTFRCQWRDDDKPGLLISTADEHKAQTFPNLQQNHEIYISLRDRAMLAPMNKAFDRINDQLMQSLREISHVFMSVDTIPDPEYVVNYPIEILNFREPPGQAS